jgi:enoyl-[acyl-carrier protein] reductase I
MSSAKAQLESDTRVLAWEAGRKYGIRVNAISAGPLASRAASAITHGAGDAGDGKFIDSYIQYCRVNAPLERPLDADDVGRAALALCSPLAAAITGTCQYVDNGMHAMGMAVAADAHSHLPGAQSEP